MTNTEFIYIEKTKRGYQLYFDGEISDIFLSSEQLRKMLGNVDYQNFLRGKEVFNVPAYRIPQKSKHKNKKNIHTKDMFK